MDKAAWVRCDVENKITGEIERNKWFVAEQDHKVGDVFSSVKFKFTVKEVREADQI